MPGIKPIPLICLIISIIAIIVIAVILFLRLYKKSCIKRLLESGSNDKNLIKKLLFTALPAKRIITNAVIPALSVNSETDEHGRNVSSARYHVIDAVVVTRGGVIAIFRQESIKGLLSNPSVGPWVVSAGNKNTPLKNPLEENRSTISSLNAVLRKYHINNIPIHDIIVFPDNSENLKFKYHHGNILTADTLIPYINDIGKERFMSGSDISQTLSCLSACKKRGMALIKKERLSSRTRGSR